MCTRGTAGSSGNGGRWAGDDTSEVMRNAAHVIRLIDAEAAAEFDADVRVAIRKWAMQSEGAGRLRSAVELAKSMIQVVARPGDLDRDHMLLNVENGTTELRTGQLRPHRRADLLTKLAPVTYDATAACPRWDSFLEEILPSAELRAFVRRMIGYALTGDVSEQSLFIAHGGGANGKSVFLETIKSMLGDYAQAAAKETFTPARDSDKVPNDLASMAGARLVAVVETDEDRRLDEALVKAITGGDEVRARFMRAEWFSYKPTAKPILVTNHKPNVRGDDYATWRRIKPHPLRSHHNARP